MFIGKSQSLEYELWPANATDKTVTWCSSNPEVATVNEYGVVTAVSAGKVTIYATGGNGNRDSLIVTVYAK